MGSNLIRIGVMAALVTLCVNWTEDPAASQGLQEGLPTGRFESSDALQASDIHHTPKLTLTASDDESGSGAQQLDDSSGNHDDNRSADAAASQNSGGAGAQYDDETIPSNGPAAPNSQGKRSADAAASQNS